MTAFDQLVQRKAEAHLNACLEALDAQDAGHTTTGPASAPFCGCNTCVVREILIVTYDLMLTEARREILQEIANTGPPTTGVVRIHGTATTITPVDRDEDGRPVCERCGQSEIYCDCEPHPTEIEDLCDADD